MRKLLIADDDPGFRDYVATVAEEMGYAIHAVEDGRGIQEACLAFGPDVILVDMVMPGVDGIEAIKNLSTTVTDARIILVSGHSATYLNAARAIASASGVEDIKIAEKPFGLSELREMLA